MTNDSMLRAGQVIKIIDALYRVEYVNESRARIVPLTKKHVTLEDGSEFDAALRALNISPRSPVEIVTDLQRAKDELELAAAERELASLTRERQRDQQELAAIEQELAESRAALAAAPAATPAARPHTAATTGTRGGGWRVGPVPAPPFKPGTLAAVTMSVIAATPGLTTKQIVEAVQMEGAVAACVSRFNQAGYIERVP